MINSPRVIAILSMLNQRGPMNRLDLELALGMPQLSNAITKLRDRGMVRTRPKKRLQPVEYELTPKGRSEIDCHIQRQSALGRLSFREMPVYVPPVDSTYVRPGAMRAFQLPSRGIA